MTEMLLQFNSLGDQVVVVAATNRIHDIDPALLRRFERKVYIYI
jgi:SpoVK/Ycf46/Vps4 family AAA+-type ATPase